jgi:hypothetical protein
VKKIATYNIFLLSICIIINSISIQAQNSSGFQYINPLPNSYYVSINSNILIRQGSVIKRSSVNDNLVEASGSKSGRHTGKIILADDSRTLIFTPYTPFQTGEEVTVKLNNGLITSTGLKAGELIFKFHTCINANTLLRESAPASYKKSDITRMSLPLSTTDSTLPSDLPLVIIDSSNNPFRGYFFLSASPYLEIVDNEGTPVFYQNVNGDIYGFDLQPDGELTYFVYPVFCYGMNSTFNLLRTFSTINGYSVDVHELRIFPNGNYYIFGKRNVLMDMSKIVNGGNPNAEVIDGALQEFDSTGNLIFQWDALDHYNITDVDSNIDLTQNQIDFSHFNSVEIDSDGHLLISARNLDEITKVDHNTGNIIWRWGGKNNQFNFINDNIGFSRQHDIRRFLNGNYSLFDNGVYHANPVSSAVKYKLDEINKTATLINRIYHDKIFTDTEGSVEELPNGNRIISWGHSWNPVLTEVTPAGSMASALSYQYFIDTYRAFKYQWETTLFITNTDSLNFGKVKVGDLLLKQFTIYNFQDTTVSINNFYCSDSSFSTNIKLPITLKPKDSLVVPITFKPAHEGNFSVSFNIRSIRQYLGSQQMIARQVILSGTTGDISSVKSNISTPGQFILSQNYPNPFNPTTVIEYQLPKDGFVTLKIYNTLGKEIRTLVNENKKAGKYSISFDASKLASSVYFYQLKLNGGSNNTYISTMKMLMMK